jgi:hypothetical protein
VTFIVQRSFDGRSWATRTGADDQGEACSLADQLANRADRGMSFRVVNSATGEVVFTVENPS